MRCEQCNKEVVRVARGAWERLLYSAVYWCPECERKTAIPRYPHLFISLRRRCPRCAGHKLERLRRRDRIDPLYHNPISLVQALFGARLWWCPLCRLQFYDLRPGAQSSREEKPAATRG